MSTIDKDLLDNYTTRLQQALLEGATSQGALGGVLLSSPDIVSRWESLQDGFIPDAVREFNSYPEATLAWAVFLGMAVAFDWDSDWENLSRAPYSRYEGEGGFDTMDEHILEDIIGAARGSERFEGIYDHARSLSSLALAQLSRSGAEPGTIDAYRAFLETLRAMYGIGAAIMLHSLGYKMERIG